MLALVLVNTVPIVTKLLVAKAFGLWPGIAAGVAAFVASVLAVAAFYRAVGRWAEEEQRRMLKEYPSIYRVTALPTGRVVTAEGAIVEIGDYGWEAEPVENDGRIYLHGLTEDWFVVWYAGFMPDHVVKIGPKPRSQYYLPLSWACAGSNPPPCPFPVRTPQTNHLGHPCRIIGKFVQGRRL